MTVSIETLVVGPLENNAYLLTDTTGHHVLVDAADEADRLLEWIGGRRIDTIVTTHRHRDHIGALARMAAATGAALDVGEAVAVRQVEGHAHPVGRRLGQPGEGVGAARQVRGDMGARPARQRARLVPGVLLDHDRVAEELLGRLELAPTDQADVVRPEQGPLVVQ